MEVKMRKMIFQAVAILFFVSIVVQPAQAADKESLENRIRGWISAVNEGNYYLCISYVAPPEFTGGRGLTRMISGGEEFLLFSGEKLLPFSEYKINKIEFFNNGYESRVNIDAKVIYQKKPVYIKKEGTTSEYNMFVFPATITQRWIFFNGKWFIRSLIRLQYLGSS
jgi:hypothetical protein